MAEIGRMSAPMMAMMGGGAGGGRGTQTFSAYQAGPVRRRFATGFGRPSAPSAQVKAALARFREVKKQKQAELAKAQDALKEVLSVRQEAALALAGYLE